MPPREATRLDYYGCLDEERMNDIHDVDDHSGLLVGVERGI